MAQVLAGMTMSLDGYINDREGSVDKLYNDFDELHQNASFQKMIEETGAVVMGRNAYEMADPFSWVNEEYEFQVPIFVVTHTPPEKFPEGNEKLSLTFVTDGIESAIAQAKEAAGEKSVQVIGGASTVQQCLNAGLCDVLNVDIVPVLLGGGKKLFEQLETDNIKLEKLKIEETTSARTSCYFTVVK